jgi:hypothetical protein
MDTIYKKGQLVKHPKKDDWGIGVVLEDSYGLKVSVSFENEGIKLLSLDYVKLVIIDSTPITEIDFRRRTEKNRLYVDEPFIDIYDDLKSKFPSHIVIIENGAYYDMLEEDALFFEKEFKYQIYDHAIDVMGVGFPIQGLTNILKKLRKLQSSYIVVNQLPNPNQGKIQRKVSEVFSG